MVETESGWKCHGGVMDVYLDAVNDECILHIISTTRHHVDWFDQLNHVGEAWTDVIHGGPHKTARQEASFEKKTAKYFTIRMGRVVHFCTKDS